MRQTDNGRMRCSKGSKVRWKSQSGAQPELFPTAQKMADLSDAVIALPGGCGTLEELLEIITWKQLGLYLNPIVILNVNGFFDPLLEMLEKAIDENFMRRQHGDIWKVAQTPEEAVELLYSTPVWDISIRKFAAI